jgi:holliday junction DNA helicase RuvA
MIAPMSSTGHHQAGKPGASVPFEDFDGLGCSITGQCIGVRPIGETVGWVAGLARRGPILSRMITWIEGTLESIEGLQAVIRDQAGDGPLEGPRDGRSLRLAYEVMLPAYFAERARQQGRAGSRLRLVTIQYLEGQSQGAWFIPRLIGFPSASDRRFFELLTTVDGLGNKKALRAMAREPAEIAAAIVNKQIPWLTALPEIGKKTAEKIVLELASKVGPFLALDASPGAPSIEPKLGSEAQATAGEREALAALVALGETPQEAARLVARALAAQPTLALAGASGEAILAAIYARRG